MHLFLRTWFNQQKRFCETMSISRRENCIRTVTFHRIFFVDFKINELFHSKVVIGTVFF